MISSNHPTITLTSFTQLPKQQLQSVLKWRNHHSVRKWSLDSGIINLNHHLQFVEKLQRDTANQFWLASKKNLAIGVASLTNITNHQGIIGIYINPELQHQGFGTQLLAFFLKFLGSQYPGLILKINVFAANIPAVKLYQKFGFYTTAQKKFPKRGMLLSMVRENNEV